MVYWKSAERGNEQYTVIDDGGKLFTFAYIPISIIFIFYD